MIVLMVECHMVHNLYAVHCEGMILATIKKPGAFFRVKWKDYLLPLYRYYKCYWDVQLFSLQFHTFFYKRIKNVEIIKKAFILSQGHT